MSPISVEMKIGGQDIKLPDILAGTPISLTDADASNPSIIIVSCNPEDDGGVVYRQTLQETQEVLDGKLRLVSDVAGEVEAVIGMGDTIKLPITARLGEVALLTLRHYTIESNPTAVSRS